jgi:hypothetical protein
LAFVLAAFVSVPTSALAQEQGLSSWKLESDQATAAYYEATERAEFQRRAEQQKAAQTLMHTLEAELTKAKRRRDDDGVAALTKHIEAARRAGRLPPPRPDGVVSFGGHDYALIEEAKTWHEAKADCERRGGHLLLLDTEEEEAFILSKWKNVEFWIGATDLYTPDEFFRIDGEPFRAFAAPFRADNYRQRQSAVGWYVPDQDWNDFDDGQRVAYVCEWE